MASITHYQLREFDTLESIALRFLGDAQRWTEIVAINNLRAPFISDDPKYQYGFSLESGQFSVSVPQGTLTLNLPLSTYQLATAKGVLVIEQYFGGIRVLEAMELASNGVLVSTGDTQLTFTKPTSRAYDINANWNLYANPRLQTSKVAKTGDVLIIQGSLRPDITDTQDEFARLLGADASLDDKTRQLHWDSTTHDLKLIKGVDNLEQALRLKLVTNQGELPFHPTYGNRLLQFVGVAATPIFATLAAGIVKECLLADPRLFSVENTLVRVEGDVCTVDTQARVRGLDTLIKVSSLGIGLS